MNWNQQDNPAIPACWRPIMAENRAADEPEI